MMHRECLVQHKPVSSNHQLLVLYELSLYYSELAMFVYAPLLCRLISSHFSIHSSGRGGTGANVPSCGGCVAPDPTAAYGRQHVPRATHFEVSQIFTNSILPQPYEDAETDTQAQAQGQVTGK